MTDKKNKTELWKFYLNGDLEKLNVDELKELQALIEKHGAIQKETKVEIVEKIVEPESKIEMESETKYTNDGEENLHSWFNEYTKDFEVPKVERLSTSCTLKSSEHRVLHIRNSGSQHRAHFIIHIPYSLPFGRFI